jgi:hypothetical protein
MVAPGVDVGRVEPEIGPFALDRWVEERLDAVVDLAAEPRDPGFRRGRLWLLLIPSMPIALTSSPLRWLRRSTPRSPYPAPHTPSVSSSISRCAAKPIISRRNVASESSR